MKVLALLRHARDDSSYRRKVVVAFVHLWNKASLDVVYDVGGRCIAILCTGLWHSDRVAMCKLEVLIRYFLHYLAIHGLSAQCFVGFSDTTWLCDTRDFVDGVLLWMVHDGIHGDAVGVDKDDDTLDDVLSKIGDRKREVGAVVRDGFRVAVAEAVPSRDNLSTLCCSAYFSKGRDEGKVSAIVLFHVDCPINAPGDAPGFPIIDGQATW